MNGTVNERFTETESSETDVVEWKDSDLIDQSFFSLLPTPVSVVILMYHNTSNTL